MADLYYSVFTSEFADCIMCLLDHVDSELERKSKEVI